MHTTAAVVLGTNLIFYTSNKKAVIKLLLCSLKMMLCAQFVPQIRLTIFWVCVYLVCEYSTEFVAKVQFYCIVKHEFG